jgi:regulator of sigma E protease
MLTVAILLILVANGLILVHELGHLLAAKWAGMPVICFSVGFGPALFGFRVGQTRYQLALIPLGGYVRIMGMKGTEEDRSRWPGGFAFQPLSRRMTVIAAGVLANVVLAAVIYTSLALTGGATVPTPARVAEVFEEDLPPGATGWERIPRDVDILRLGSRNVRDWGEFALVLLGAEPGEQTLWFVDGSRRTIEVPDDQEARMGLLASLLPPMPPVLGRIEAGSPAERAGLRTGDRIAAVDGAPVASFHDWLEAAPAAPSSPVRLRILREGEGLDVKVPPPDPGFIPGGSFGWIGAHLGTDHDGTDVGGAVAYGASELQRHTRMIAQSGRLLVTGAVGLRELSGPVEIIRMSQRAFQMDWHQFFAFIAFLSLNLAILNFLPIPVLDGGYFALLLAEGFLRRPLPRSVYRYGNLAGATVVLFFMSFAVLNDLLKLLGL